MRRDGKTIWVKTLSKINGIVNLPNEELEEPQGDAERGF
jgi:hypothetical protein